MKRCELVWTGLRSYIAVSFSFPIVLKSIWTDLKQFMVLGSFFIFWGKAMIRCEPVWTALRFYVVVTLSWAKVRKSVGTGLNRFMVFFEQKPWNRVNRYEPVYVFTLLWHSRLLKSLNRCEPVWTGLWIWVILFFEQKDFNRCEPV